MTAEEKIEQAKKNIELAMEPISQVIVENMDVEKEEWFHQVCRGQNFANLSRIAFEKALKELNKK